MQDIGAIDLKNIKSKHPNVGQVLTTKFKNQYIFSVIVLQRHYENLSMEALEKGIRNLKRVCKRKGVNSLQIARNCSATNNLPPGALAQALSKVFTSSNISITLCYSNTSTVPEHERLGIIQLLHSSPFRGHKGITQTYRKIRERFYWRNIRDDITESINNCASCQENKITRAKTRNPMITPETPIEAFDKVSIDTVGKLRTTTAGNCHILTMQCHLTKYLLAIPLLNIKATTIANAQAKNLICQFGAPRAILSDRGTSFLSEIVRKQLQVLKIEHLTSNGY
uniref:RNA-directed DNA polymerase n=1 Tax=Trichogramma kaykai TaxID=54128 RepID=A0ABD2W598_9HYME